MSEDLARSIFLNALDRPADQWPAFLDAACVGDADLRAKVDALLQSHQAMGSIHPAGSGEQTTSAIAPPLETPGAVIGPYKLLEQIGEGGFGVVFKAEQSNPVRRTVALKILKPGMDSRPIVARFEAERQALALMDHSHIARVIDGGETAAGRPYFVMELVKGVPITKYCDDNRLSPRERLALLVPVCEAVQHAHQKGIIHRDIKPTNVLVAANDGKPVPKVIDFGIAKAMGQQLTERTLVTDIGGIIGTLEYMSPEQAESRAVDIDTRADIYGLGVLLYELLTGTTPLTRERVKEAALTEVLRLIREEEPPTPSSRLGASSDSIASVSAQRRSEPSRLTREVRGELDWIVMKCLEKDRGRRYATANGLARDIQRFLSDEAVEAGPPSARYKLRKFARKHRKALGVAGVLAFTLAVASGVSIWQAIRATRAEGKALKEKERANEEAAIAKAVNEFLQVDLLAQADIRNQQGIGDRNKNITVRELLDRASRGIEAKFKAQELTEAAIRSTLGQAYLGLGELVEAQKHLERARDLRLDKLGAKHADTLDTMIALGNVYLESGRYDGAESLLQQAIETNEAEFGPHHDRTLYGMARLASLYWQRGPRDKAEPLYRQVLQSRIATLGRDHVYTLESMNSMAIVHSFYDRVAEAEALHKEVLSGYRARLGNDHPKTLTGIANLAGFYRNHRRPEEAEPLFKEVLDARRNHLGPDHPDTLQALSNFAMFHSDARRYKEAESMHKQVLEGRRKTLGPEHPHTYLSMIYLANQYVFQDRHEEAEPLYRSALEGRRKTLHPDHPETLTNMNNLACMLSDRRRFDEAVTLLEDGTERAKRTLGLGHAYTKDFINNLASANDGRRTPEAAAPYLRELDSYLRSQGQTDSLVFAKNAAWLCRGLVHEEKFAEAEAVGRASLAVLQEKQPNDWSTYDMRSLLGGSLLGQKRFDEAEKLLLQGHQGVKEREAKIPKHRKDRLIEGIERLVELYDAWGKEAEAAQWRKKLTDEKAKTK